MTRKTKELDKCPTGSPLPPRGPTGPGLPFIPCEI